MKKRMFTILLALFAALPLFADKVLVIARTDNSLHLESSKALALLPAGSTVDVLAPSAVTGGIAANYRVVIFADPNCSGTVPVMPSDWATGITGNVVIIGTDPYVHRNEAFGGGTLLIEKTMDFILSNPKPGAYISLSCYYAGAAFNTPVPFLNDAFASSSGTFKLHGSNGDNAHIVATHPALAGLTDATLANWGSSVHESFDDWPKLDFIPLAIIKNSGASFNAPDGTVGSPYILVRGEGVTVISDISLTPATAVNETGTPHSVTATVTPPLPGIVVTFTVLSGPNAGLTGTALTDAAGKASFTWASSSVGVDFIQAKFTRNGVTQTSTTVRKEWIHTPKSCMRMLASKVLCETDATGRPTGNYVWQFRVQNLSGTPASHLFISNLPSPAFAVPDHLVFNPALSGISGVQTVVIKNAPPGPLTFTVSLHDGKLEHCCSAEVTLDLPECDCAQLLEEVRPSCFNWPFFTVPPPYRYRFKLQNLSAIAGQKVLVAAVSPSDLVTPVSPSQLQVTAAVNNIPTTGLGGTAGPIQLLIGGPLAVGGQKVCLNISINDKDIDDCCAVTRCFTLPDCSPRLDDFVPIGGATFERDGGRFRLSGFGGSGEDGLRIATPGAQNAALAWEPLDVNAPNGAFIELRAATNVPERSGRLRVTKTATGRYEITPVIAGAQSFRVEASRDGDPSGAANIQQGINVIVIWPVAAGAEVVHLGGEPDHGETLAFTIDTGTVINWTLPNGAVLTGNRFRITADQALSQDELTIESIELRAANLREIVVTSVSVSIDCNGNGIADAEDIANGISLDQNGNGIPDECDGSANTLVLNTGYDDVQRALLPEGEDDDDWHIVLPAPDRHAKVIRSPSTAWPAALPDSRWISSDANGGKSQPGTDRFVYRRCFCLGADATRVALDLALRADDRAIVRVNGREIGQGAELFNAAPLTIRHTGAVGDGIYVEGSNCIEVEVIDSGAIFTGLTLTGTVTANGSACAPSHHD